MGVAVPWGCGTPRRFSALAEQGEICAPTDVSSTPIGAGPDKAKVFGTVPASLFSSSAGTVFSPRTNIGDVSFYVNSSYANLFSVVPFVASLADNRYILRHGFVEKLVIMAMVDH